MTEKKTRRTKPAEPTASPEPTEPAPDVKVDLEGIEFADEPRAAADTTPGDDGAPDSSQGAAQGGGPADQAAAKLAIERMRQMEPPPQMVPPGVTPLPEQDAQRLRPKQYRVTAPAVIARGAANYTLQPGKILSANEYDLEALRQAGVQMEEVQ